MTAAIILFVGIGYVGSSVTSINLRRRYKHLADTARP